MPERAWPVVRAALIITEQRAQSRYIVQTFAQIAHFVNTGKKVEISRFRNHPEVRRFDNTFNKSRLRMLLEKSGFSRHESEMLLHKNHRIVSTFERNFSWWERKTKQKKHYRVADGITKDALYSMRDILREMPAHLNKSWTVMPIKTFMSHIASTYCGPNDATPSLVRRIWSERFQRSYMALIDACARHSESKREHIVGRMAARSSITNRRDRITGDAICNVGDKIIRSRKKLERRELFEVIASFIQDQIRVPEVKIKGIVRATVEQKKLSGKPETVLKALGRVVFEMRHGL